MLKRIIINLEQDEYSELLNIAQDDLRIPSEELRHILRLEIQRRNDLHEVNKNLLKKEE